MSRRERAAKRERWALRHAYLQRERDGRAYEDVCWMLLGRHAATRAEALWLAREVRAVLRRATLAALRAEVLTGSLAESA